MGCSTAAATAAAAAILAAAARHQGGLFPSVPFICLFLVYLTSTSVSITWRRLFNSF